MKSQKGFTLVEMAIVLVIIGLLLGGVLKGQELITNARVKSLKSEYDQVRSAMNGYLDRFKALPGDDTRHTINVPGSPAPNAAAANGSNGRVDGTGITLESGNFWRHMRAAGFTSGDATANITAATLPRHGLGGEMYVTTNTPGQAQSICFRGVNGEIVRLLDTLVDGPAAANPAANGIVLAGPVVAVGTALAAGTVLDATTDPTAMTVCMPLD